MDSMVVWFWLWLILAAGLYIGEMLTVTFFILPFAIGSTAAMIVNLVGLGLVWQWVAFLGFSVVSLAAFRPIANRLTKQGVAARSGVDRLVGIDAVVLDQPAPVGTRRAKALGEVWNVVLEPGYEALLDQLEVDERVYVLRVEGTRLVVRRYQ